VTHEAKTETAPFRHAHSIDDIVSNGPQGRTSIFKAIKEGHLKARKAGRRTIILDEDYLSYLRSLPLANEPPGE
jgi:hypothetical protein